MAWKHPSDKIRPSHNSYIFVNTIPQRLSEATGALGYQEDSESNNENDSNGIKRKYRY